MMSFTTRTLCLRTCGTAFMALTLWQCASRVGTVGSAGFEQPTYHFRLGYRDASKKDFLGPDWQLDNYFVDEFSGRWKPKQGPDYVTKREFDEDGDGVISVDEKGKEPIYDLRYINTRDDGVIWIKAHPVARGDSRRDLDIVLNDYAEGLSGNGLYAQGNLFSSGHAQAHQFATYVVSKDTIQVGPLTGLVGQIEIADVEKVKLDPASRRGKLEIVFLRFLYHERIDELASRTSEESADGRWHASIPQRWPIVTWNGKTCYERPALLIAGYYNTFSRFDERVKEFDDALRRLSFDPGSAPPEAAVAKAAPAVTAPPAPASAAAPPAAAPAAAATPAPAASTSSTEPASGDAGP